MSKRSPIVGAFKKVLVYCASGERSPLSGKILKDLG
jgi:rhodanese-related sulfurtransferase